MDEFGIVEPHTRLRVEAESTVETTEPPVPDWGGSLESLETARGELSSYLRPSPHAVWDDLIEERTRDAVSGITDVVDVSLAISGAAAKSLDYVPGATFVGMDLTDVLAQG